MRVRGRLKEVVGSAATVRSLQDMLRPRRDLIPLLCGSTAAATFSASTGAAPLRIAVVGDVHGQWDSDDNSALQGLAADLTLFVGDFGNEDVRVVRTIAQLQDKLHVASIFGNHDASNLGRGYSYTRKNLPMMGTPAPGSNPRLGRGPRFDAVREMHELLQRSNVGWGRGDFEALRLSVAGGRPLSSGGQSLERKADMYADLWGVSDAAASSERIRAQLEEAPEAHSLILLAHNGPTGLGAEAHSPCGRDWGARDSKRGARKAPATTLSDGDWGDQDLADALQACTRPIPLVVFGHMHEALQGGGLRTMVHVSTNGTVFVNAARVPRWRRRPGTSAVERSVTLIELSEGELGVPRAVASVEAAWLDPSGAVVERSVLYTMPVGAPASAPTAKKNDCQAASPV